MAEFSIMVNSKKKGNMWENRWARWLIEHGIKAWKDGGSGGGCREKSDVGNNINANFEVKGVKKLNLFKAWKQSQSASDKTHNTPYVIVHFDGMAEDEFLVVMNNYDWLDLVSGEKEVETAYEDPKVKWSIQRLVDSAKTVIKQLDVHR